MALLRWISGDQSSVGGGVTDAVAKHVPVNTKHNQIHFLQCECNGWDHDNDIHW